MVLPERIGEVMGGAAVLGAEIRSLHDLEATVSAGLPKGALRRTLEHIYTSAGELRQAIYRVVPEATFKRRDRLSLSEGERTERLARLIATAEYVLDDPEDAREWLTTPHPELEGRTPLEAAETQLGAQRAEYILDCLLFGLPV